MAPCAGTERKISYIDGRALSINEKVVQMLTRTLQRWQGNHLNIHWQWHASLGSLRR